MTYTYTGKNKKATYKLTINVIGFDIKQVGIIDNYKLYYPTVEEGEEWNMESLARKKIGQFLMMKKPKNQKETINIVFQNTKKVESSVKRQNSEFLNKGFSDGGKSMNIFNKFL
tara:strand:- start:751 stop:1092 length:342 start_codon:yes stop_codon:yes gene_type:complete